MLLHPVCGCCHLTHHISGLLNSCQVRCGGMGLARSSESRTGPTIGPAIRVRAARTRGGMYPTSRHAIECIWYCEQSFPQGGIGHSPAACGGFRRTVQAPCSTMQRNYLVGHPPEWGLTFKARVVCKPVGFRVCFDRKSSKAEKQIIDRGV